MHWFASNSCATRWPAVLPEFTTIPGDAESKLVPWPNRHNSPDLTAQLSQPNIDTVICSALDSEPTLRLNAAVAARHGDLVARGVAELVRRTGAKRAWIALESRSPKEWTDPLRAAAAATVVELPNDYPQTDPAMLLYSLTGRKLKPGRLPGEKGAVVIDAAGAATVGGLQFVPIGLLDHATGKAIYLEAAPDSSLAAVLAKAGVDIKLREVRGGDLPRKRPASLDQPVGAGEICLHLLTPVEAPEISACVRCGWCADVCPTHVKPAWVLEAAQRGDYHLARAGRRDACIECGLCDQVCPANLPLLAAIQRLKSTHQVSKSIPS